MADGISESISLELCRHYLEEFGQILHHNVDKVLIIAGKSQPEFGGGKVLIPPAVYCGLWKGNQAVRQSSGRDFQPGCGISLPDDPKESEGLSRGSKGEEGAPELRSLVGRGANDTSIGIGFAFLDPVERLVLDLEKEIGSVRGVGEDNEVMAVRIDDDLKIVVAVAMVSKYINSMQDYQEAKARVKDAVVKRSKTEDVSVNSADSGSNIFLTVTGTSIEIGDDGATGRGNRGNGLITPMRPMTMEAIAGKNPVSHVGKIYNVLAERMAKEIAELEGVQEAYVTLVSKIGSPIDKPLLRGVRICGDLELSASKEAMIDSVVDYWLERTDDLVEEFVKGKLTVY